MFCYANVYVGDATDICLFDGVVSLNSLLCIISELMYEWKIRDVKLTRQMNGKITITFQNAFVFLFLKNELRPLRQGHASLTSRIFYSSMSSNIIHSS